VTPTIHPDAHLRLSIENREGTHRFQRVFICPSVSRETFRHCRTLIAMDGTFMKDIFNLTVLLAVTTDAQNHNVLLAWAVVEGENEHAWRFFLSNLQTAIPQVNHPATTIISDRDKGLRAADDEIPLASRAICLEHLSRNIQQNFGLQAKTIFDARIRYALTDQGLEAGFNELGEHSQRAVNYLRGIDLALWATPRFPGKRYGHNTSNLVESTNSWILEERKLSILDFLHHVWTKNMDLRFRRLQEAQKYDPAAVLTKYAAQLLEESTTFSNHRLIRFADPMHASVLSFQGNWYVVDLEARTCTCGHFQFNDVPCGHAIAVIQTYRDPAGGPRRSAREFVAYNLTVPAFRATYAVPMPAVDIAALQPRPETPCRCPVFKKPRGRRRENRLVAGENRALHNGAHRGPAGLGNIPDHIQRCSRCHQMGHNVRRCQAVPEAL
jgi:hypothetical protein